MFSLYWIMLTQNNLAIKLLKEPEKKRSLKSREYPIFQMIVSVEIFVKSIEYFYMTSIKIQTRK